MTGLLRRLFVRRIRPAPPVPLRWSSIWSRKVDMAGALRRWSER